MSGSLAAVVFVVLFVAVAVLIAYASGNRRRLWAKRSGVMRAFAERRGYQVIENPGDPRTMLPIRASRADDDVRRWELPVALRGRSLDTQLTMFDLYTEKVSGISSSKTYQRTYETLITFRSPDRTWPHFEFVGLQHVDPDSLTAKLLTTAANLTAGIMETRGLHSVTIPNEPGFQLYVGDTASGEHTRDALMRVFNTRTGWWAGAQGDTLTLSKAMQKTAGMNSFVPETELEPFVNEAIEIERGLRSLATTPQ